MALGLGEYVHFSLRSDTPLLIDKLKKGYAHAVIVLDADPIIEQYGTTVLRFNTKSWRTRAALRCEQDRASIKRIITLSQDKRRWPSAEVLARYGVSLGSNARVLCMSEAERLAVREVLDSVSPDYRIECETIVSAPEYEPTTFKLIQNYFAQCSVAGTVVPPPMIPFD